MWLGFSLFCMIFGPRIAAYWDVVSVTSVALTLVFGLQGGAVPREVRSSGATLGVWLVALLVYSGIVFARSDQPETYYLIRFVRVGVQLCGSYALAGLYYQEYGNEMGERILIHLFWAIGAHAVVIGGMYVSESVREFVWSVTQPELQREKRVGGLTGSLDTLSVVQAFGILLLPVVLTKTRGMLMLLAMAVAAIGPFSALIAGRTGIVLGVPSLIGIVFHKWRRLARLIPLTIAMAMLLAAVLVAITAFSEDVQQRWAGQVERLQRLVAPAAYRGYAPEDVTVAKLLDDYRYGWPESAAHLILGDSRSGRTESYRIDADPGWILDVNGIGIIGTLLTLFFYWYCLRNAALAWRCHREAALYSLVYSIWVLLVHSKVLFLLARTGFTISCLLLFATVYARCMASGRHCRASLTSQSRIWRLAELGQQRCRWILR